MTAPVLVLGIGNPLVGDEGVGVRVLEHLLSNWDFGNGVELVDAGTMGMSMLGLLADRDEVIVADAVDGTGTEPGTVTVFSPDELASSQVLHSLHDIKLTDVLQAAALLGQTPRVRVVGVQVGEMRQGVIGLTPPVEAAVSVAAAEVLRLLHDIGVSPREAVRGDDPTRVLRAIHTKEPMTGDRPQGAGEPPESGPG
ncbi:MAG: HyaD/HybD family hydrogenase maturation endopeptidase [Coriobacteriia bacterium]